MQIKTLVAASLSAMMLVFVSFGASAEGKPVQATVESQILGQKRTIQIALPPNYDKSNKSYPVMYLLDSDTHIAHTVGSNRYLSGIGAAPEIIVVGILNINRFYDLTPTKAKDSPANSGGGENMLDFIEKELMPYINKNYRTADYSMFTGHSLGGLMVIHALGTRPNLFDAHFAFSPSLWFDEQQTLKMAKATFSKNPQMKTYLYTNLGNEPGNMITGFDALEQLLKDHAPAKLSYKLERFPNETHMTIPLLGQVRAYRDLYANWQIPRKMFDRDAAHIVAFYQELSNTFGYEILPDESGVNNMGYYHLDNKKDADAAVALFQLNVKNYPHSSNVYDSLADGLEGQGKLKKALKMVNKAIELAGEKHINYQVYVEHRDRLKAVIEKG